MAFEPQARVNNEINSTRYVEREFA